WALPVLIMFVIVLGIFKGIGQFVHHKVYVHYKHYTDDLERGWWERMNHRVGMCVGTLNALVYVIILSSVIYVFSYWTTQIATADDEKWTVRLLNRAGHGLEETGMIKVARAVNPLPPPENYFQMADVAGLLYQNPQLDQRLAYYPPFIGIAQQGEFQDLGQDSDFQNAWQNHGHLAELVGNEHAKAIWQNPDTANLVWNMVATNFDDLQNYLQTGTSEKFDDPIFGRWHFNVVSSVAMMAQSQPNFSSKDMMALRAVWTPAYAKTEFLASAGGQAFLKNVPQFKPQQPNQPPQFDLLSYTGQWEGADGSYQVNVSGNNDKKSGFGKTSGARLTLTLNGTVMIFDR
ncbi:MAG TPA: hypothetical protein VN516_03945, partial [Candidatus Baltobacteraceae bacterium]|nr:hypothetical protein [Candidatus Baltobacteraceae bacterium]